MNKEGKKVPIGSIPHQLIQNIEGYGMKQQQLRNVLCAVLFSIALVTPAQATQIINLFDWGLNIDGETFCDFGPCTSDGLTDLTGVSGVDDSGFDFATGIGTILVTVEGAGAHSVDLFVDHDIDEAINTFFNEFGFTLGTPAAGQSWEIDEPGFLFGDIFDNFLVSSLDNTNAVPQGSEDDVSMALGWDFNLGAGETANIAFVLEVGSVCLGSTLNGAGFGFQLCQEDPDTASTSVPEPTTFMLLGGGLLGLFLNGQKRRRTI